MPYPIFSPSLGKRAPRGFALLVTIVLVAFLVLILVGLASFTRVETQVAGNAQQLAAARQNALLGLNIALGQLQRYAGPDQRITARADIRTNSNPGATNWTGVWGNQSPSSTLGEPSPVLLNWLVSGNETAAFASSTAAATFGQITSAPPSSGVGSIPFRPEQSQPTTTASTTATTDLQANGTNYRLLIGPGTVGTGPGIPAASFVVAPLVDVETPASQLPGFASTDSTMIKVGRYAYWVGDEGVKAKFNLPVNETSIAAAASTELNRALFASAPRAGVEQIDGFATYAAPGSYLATANNPTGRQARTQLRQTVAPQQLPFYANGAIAPNDAKNRYHDITTHGGGVIADTLRGGLRLDLTRGLAAGATQPAGVIVANPQVFTGLGNASFTTQDQAGFTRPPVEPSWDILRSYYNLRYNGANPVTPRAQTGTVHGIHPLVSSITLNLGYTTYNDAGSTRVRFTIAPVVNMWNPYNVPLEPANYVVQYRNMNFVRMSLRFFAAGVALRTDQFPLHQSSDFFPDNDSSSPSSRGFRFRIPAAGFAPGEVRQFSLAADTNYSNGVTLADHSDAPAIAASNTTFEVPPTADLVRIFTFAVDGFTQVELYSSINLLLDLPSGTDPVLQKADDSQVRRTNQSGNPFGAFDVFAGHHVLKNPADAYNYQIDGSNSGGLRVLADMNIRARYTSNGSAGGSWNRNPLWHAADANPLNVVVNQWPGSSPSSSGSVNGVWGPSSLPSAEAFVSLFDIPRADLVSIGQLQHAQFISLGTAAGHAFGNSYASPFVSAGQPDLSYSLNRALWDRFYFSTVPGGLSQADFDDPNYSLPNTRLRFHSGENPSSALDDLVANGYERATSRILIDGAFNINSTSIPAWRAQLASLNALPLAIRDVASSASVTTLTPPSSAPVGASARLSAFTNPIPRTLEPNGPNDAPWRGFRTLSAEQIDELAERIVEQIREQGPFLSLSHFINRRLADNDSGPLQRAIDGLGTTAPSLAETRINPPPTPGAPSSSLLPDTLVNSPPSAKIANRLANNGKPRATLAPGWLSQADLLTALGPVVSSRSDTFVIRSYGETLSPLDDTAPLARAWCEVVVQRMPEYLDTTIANQEAWRAPTTVSQTNQDFGRRFQIVSFRWLNPEDI